MIKIEKNKYEEILNQSINFANYLGFEKDKNQIHNDEYLNARIIEYNDKAPLNGLYITDFFLKDLKNDKIIDDKNNNYKYSEIYEDKSLIESIKIDDYTTSTDLLQFDDKFLQDANNELSVKSIINEKMKNSYCFFAFPMIINNEVFITLVNVLMLPFEINFNFSTQNNDIISKLLFNNEDIAQYYNNAIETGLKRINNNAYSVRLFYVKDKTKTYTDFLKFLYADNTPESFEELSENTKKLINDIEIKNFANNIVFSLKSDQSESKNVVISNIAATNKNISFYNGNAPDARLLYWEKCITNDVKKEVTHTNKNSNYYDISFDCKYLKAFTFSNFSPGYYVIDYAPVALYKNDLEVVKGINSILNLREVYNDIFRRKILELEFHPIA